MQRKLLRSVGILVIAVVVILVVAALLSYRKTPERKAADTFVTAVLANQGEQSYALFSADAQQQQDKAEWVATVTQLSLFFKGQKTTYLSEQKGASQATVRYSIKGQDEHTYMFSLVVKKSDSGWQVFSFRSLQSDSTGTAGTNP